MKSDTIIPKPHHMFSELIGCASAPHAWEATNAEYLLKMQMKRGELKLALNLLSNDNDISPLLIVFDKTEPQRLFHKYAGACKVAYISESNLESFYECASSLFVKSLNKKLTSIEIYAFALMRILEFVAIAELAPENSIFISVNGERFASAVLATEGNERYKPVIVLDFPKEADTAHSQNVNFINKIDFESYIKNYIIKEKLK